MAGLSETLQNHFTLYQGYVTNTNKVLDTLDQMTKDGKTACLVAVKRRLGWDSTACGSMNIISRTWAERQANKDGKLGKRSPTFGATKLGKRTSGRPALRGHRLGRTLPGPASGRLINFWINEHDVSHPAGCTLLLIMTFLTCLHDRLWLSARTISAFFRTSTGWLLKHG
jgi:Fe-Mn family superoxide dismutase